MSPISWSSHKQKRVANSTLSSEAMACTEAIDELDHVIALWCEFTQHGFCIIRWARGLGNKVDPYMSVRSGVVAIDARCLYDSVTRCEVAKPSCKRTAIEVLLIHELISRSGHMLKWIPTREMLSDCLTKAGKQEARLLEVLSGGGWSLVEQELEPIINVLLETMQQEPLKFAESLRCVIP